MSWGTAGLWTTGVGAILLAGWMTYVEYRGRRGPDRAEWDRRTAAIARMASPANRPRGRQDAPRRAHRPDYMAEAIQQYTAAVEERLRRVVDAGIGIERIRQITYAGCPECAGSGMVHALRDDRTIVIGSCPRCPGYVVDWDRRCTG